MKLWDKGISIDKKIEAFTVGNDREIDVIIAAYDVKASLAHAKMLAAVELLTDDELVQLTKGLNQPRVPVLLLNVFLKFRENNFAMKWLC